MAIKPWGKITQDQNGLHFEFVKKTEKRAKMVDKQRRTAFFIGVAMVLLISTVAANMIKRKGGAENSSMVNRSNTIYSQENNELYLDDSYEEYSDQYEDDYDYDTDGIFTENQDETKIQDQIGNYEENNMEVYSTDNTYIDETEKPIQIENQLSVNKDVIIDFDVEDRTDTQKAIDARNNYEEIIGRIASMYGVDKDIMLAIATQERGVHSEEIDAGGGLGLMQIQYNLWCNKTLGAYNYSTNEYEEFQITDENIRTLEGNVKIACMLMQSNYEYFNGALLPTIQAYNYGTGNVLACMDKCREETGISEEDFLNNGNNEWLEYRDGYGGDAIYVEHILSYLNNDELKFNNKDEEIVYSLIRNTNNRTKGGSL